MACSVSPPQSLPSSRPCRPVAPRPARRRWRASWPARASRASGAEPMLKIEDVARGIRCIGLDRAAKRNAIGVELTLAMEEVLLRTRDDPAVRVVVFHGIGGHFCAGM